MSRHSTTLASFDAADYLDSEETIAEFLAAAADEDVDAPGVFMQAVEAVAKARGIAQIAADSGLSRESLYKALAPGAQPRFDTVRRVLGALGVGLAVVPRAKGTARDAAKSVPNPSGVPLAKKSKPRVRAFKVAPNAQAAPRRSSSRSRDSRKSTR